MGKTIRTIAFCGLAAMAFSQPLPLVATAQAAVTSDPREMAPSGIIGMWKADIAASTFSGEPPLAMYRSFAYTEEGKVLVSFASHFGDGRITSGHWAAQVDGVPGIEYHSSAGGLPYSLVSWKLAGEGRLDVTVMANGETTFESSYQLSADGVTLSYSYGETTVIYRRWDLLG